MNATSQDSVHETAHSLGDTITRWWHRVSRNWAAVRELDNLDAGELQNIAKDVGCDVPELQTLAGKWPESADLLPRRLDALHLDAPAFSRENPQLANDLRKHCSLCAVKGQCEHDLETHPHNPVWQSYCPNTMTLLAVSKARAKPPEDRTPGP